MTVDDPFRPFEAPDHGPQFDLGQGSIADLMATAPQFTDDMIVELLHLCKQHHVVRSAIMFAMEVCKDAELKLRVVNTLEEMKFNQGIVHGLNQYTTSLLSSMIEVETKKDTPDELEN